MSLKSFARQKSPIVLAIMASAGVIATAVMAVKATPKAVELIKADSRAKHDGDPDASTKTEAVLAAWKCYIPAAAFGGATIACIVGANMLNTRQQLAIGSAYSLAKQSFKEYKNKLKELYGEEADKKIEEAIKVDKCRDVSIYADTLGTRNDLDPGETVEPDILRTFYDSFSDRYFESTLAKVIEAEYHINRNYVLGEEVTLNEFYDFLGLDHTDAGDDLSWYGLDGVQWLDFNHRMTVLDDGMEVCVIDMAFEPVAEEDDI